MASKHRSFPLMYHQIAKHLYIVCLPAEVILEIAKEGKTLFPRLSCSQLQESIV